MPPQQQLPIQQVKGMMQQLKNASNPQQVLMSMIQENPQFAQITQMMKSAGGLEPLARQMAQQKGINLDNLIQELIGGQ